ncbi:redoxin domain-containing protein [Panacibacter ginsenosidivorans]|uniref:Redoxin domain-containing protein n=1 Tax=Panacibacter ginsenosidivorans TaxID=1813871 RepID=A0A5B8V9C1_9BACT|nr:redoxin domain-containing protein [Panacibacter ginsenosidivorans]QEC67922.1 redoxin domain-containing protein [Panacibacter ginsenosidivorans]
MQKIILLLFIIVFPGACFSQDSLTWVLATTAVKRDGKEIHIGEKVADINFNRILNNNNKRTTLYNFLDKPLIIDFWHQYCTVCVGEFSRLEKLRQRFKDSVNILLVTFQSNTSTNEFFERRKAEGKPVLLPCVTEDTLLRKTFGHEGDPHIVWINTNGTVQAITSHIALNETNLSAWLKHGNIDLAVKSNQRDFDPYKPLLVNNNGGASGAFHYRSVLTGYIDSIPALSLFVRSDDKQTKLAAFNTTIDQLFKDAYAMFDTTAASYLNLDWLNKRVLYEYQDSSTAQYYSDAYDAGYGQLTAFQRNHLYCYELDLPVTFTTQQAAGIMLDELSKLFAIKPFTETRSVTGLALIRTADTDRLKTKGIAATGRIQQDSTMIVKDMPVSALVNVLNLNYYFPLVVDETGYPGNIDITIPLKEKDLHAVETALMNYGLALVPKRYDMPMLVLESFK